MSVKIRLKRVGMPKQPYYRLVAIDTRSARDGKELEVLGHYNPRAKNNALSFIKERVDYWISCGAKPSDTVRSLLKDAPSTSAKEPLSEPAGSKEKGNAEQTHA